MNETAERKTVTVEIDAKKYMPDLIWVLKACSTDDYLPLLQNLYVDDDCFVCTDGRRMHICSDIESLPDGLAKGAYKVTVSKNMIVFVPYDTEFPAYKKVIPDAKDNKINLCLSNNDKKASDRHSPLSVAMCRIVVEVLKGQYGIQFNYVKDLDGYDWKVAADNTTLKAQSGALTAVMSGLRI